jgi:hypothetical protein
VSILLPSRINSIFLIDVQAHHHQYFRQPELCLENWERLGSKLVVVAVGLEPTSGAQSISESAIRRAAAADGPVAFSYITR